MTAEAIVFMLRAWSTPVHLWVDEAGQLRASPAGVLTEAARRVLAMNKPALVRYLRAEENQRRQPPMEARSR